MIMRTTDSDSKKIKTSAIKIKPIKSTPVVKGKYLIEIIKEVTRPPSLKAIKRNKSIVFK